MRMLWEYLTPHRGLIALSLLLAGIAQVLALVDPIIFGWIIDRYTTNRDGRSADELVTGALGLLALAEVVANRLAVRHGGAGVPHAPGRAEGRDAHLQRRAAPDAVSAASRGC